MRRAQKPSHDAILTSEDDVTTSKFVVSSGDSSMQARNALTGVPVLYMLCAVAFIGYIQTQHAKLLLQRINDLSPALAPFVIPSALFFVAHNSYALFAWWLDRRPTHPLARFKIYFATADQAMPYSRMMPWIAMSQSLVYGTVFVTWYFELTTLSADPKEMPSWISFLLQTTGVYLIFDAAFYFSHRIMHWRPLFFLHERHHDLYASAGISGLYASPLDYFMISPGPMALACALTQCHVTVLWFTAFIGAINSVHSHSGYEFPLMPSMMEHALHHYKYRVNFATGPCDILFGTYQAATPETAAWLNKQTR